MSDKLLHAFFVAERWERAIEKGVDKDIRKDQLIKLAETRTRQQIAQAMCNNRYAIAPPHTAKIPKDDGSFRTVYVNEPIDRVVLSIANDLLFESMPHMIHPSCKSYLTGIGCGKVVKEASQQISKAKAGEILGWKADLSKYFDSVPIQYIDEAFDAVEERYGQSALISVLRNYYHCDIYFDENNKLQKAYQSLKQGCAVAAWLADVILYHIDDELSQLDGYYVRYCDDMLFIGRDHQKAFTILKNRLAEMDMSLNPRKVEMLSPNRWFKFLGFSIKGPMISLSSTRIKKFQDEIEKRTIDQQGITPIKAVNAVNRFLYKGDGKHSWASQILGVCNVKSDIITLNCFVMDCLRAVHTGKHKIGGLGFVATKSDGCIVRGLGRNVTSNRLKTQPMIDGYLTLGCMQNALRTSKAAYNTLVASL
jgi:RNA-directed DNA polymerase